MEFCGLWFVVRGGRRAQEGVVVDGPTPSVYYRGAPYSNIPLPCGLTPRLYLFISWEVQLFLAW